MKTYLSKTIVIVIGLVCFSPGVTLPDVIHQQINAVNTVVHVSDDTWQPEGFDNGTVIPAHYARTPVIDIDGIDDEPQWANAFEVEIPLAYGTVQSASLKALYSDEEVFIRVRWKDSTEDREHHPWVWDSFSEKYVSGPQVEDSLFLSFEAGCEWTPSLLSGYVYDFDGWHWLAARSDPTGQALDLAGTAQDQEFLQEYLQVYASRNDSAEWNLKFTDKGADMVHDNWDELDRVYLLQPVNETVFLYIQPDGRRTKQEFVRELPPPEFAPINPDDIFSRYQPVKLQGQAAEVAAKGRWHNGYWTVEFRRLRVTPARTANDTMFNRLTQFSVYVSDSVERVDQASESGRLFLRLMEEERFDEGQLIAGD